MKDVPRGPNVRLPFRSEHLAYAAVAALLAMAIVLDWVTGSGVSAAAFYVFPVGLAGWRFGVGGGVVTSVVATLLNVGMDHSWPEHPLSTGVLITNEVLLSIVFLALAALSSSLGREQRALASQRDEIAAHRDEIAGQHQRIAHLHRQLEGELRAAKMLQQVLLGPPPAHPAVEIHTRLEAARALGGDTLHLALDGQERLAIAIADVSGKGSRAALAGAVLVGLMEDAPERFGSPRELLRYLNQRLESRLPDEMFVTMYYAVLDLRTGVLTYASAGHEPTFRLRPGGGVESLEIRGFPLGVIPEAEFEEATTVLKPADTLFCCTDGVTDRRQRHGTGDGEEWLRAQLAAGSEIPTSELVTGVYNAAVEAGEALTDDVTVVAIRYLGPCPARV